MIHNIELFGNMGKTFGKTHQAWGLTPRAVVLGLGSKLPEIRAYLLRGKHWHVFVNGKKVSNKALDKPIKKGSTVQVVPVIAGGELISATALWIIAAILLVGAVYLYTQMPNMGGEDQEKSYMFNGALNSNEQGGPVPLVYGHTRVGSVVISSAITNEEMIDSKYSNLFNGPGSPWRGLNLQGIL